MNLFNDTRCTQVLNLKQNQNVSLRLAALSLAIALATNVQAQQDDWPCAQILVPNVSAAVIWPYPIDEKIAERWRSNTDIKALATKIANQFSIGDDEIVMIDQYLGKKSPEARSQAATDLFVATLTKFNSRRLKYINGIKKFTAKQKGLAQRLSVMLEQRDEFLANEKTIEQFKDEIFVAEQIFRNRESILTDLCEQPVRVEENLGMVARAIAQHVE